MPISELKLAKEVWSVNLAVHQEMLEAYKSNGKRFSALLVFNCKVINFKNVKNLYARLGKSSPNFCYAGHTDVVYPPRKHK